MLSRSSRLRSHLRRVGTFNRRASWPFQASPSTGKISRPSQASRKRKNTLAFSGLTLAGIFSMKHIVGLLGVCYREMKMPVIRSQQNCCIRPHQRERRALPPCYLMLLLLSTFVREDHFADLARHR